MISFLKRTAVHLWSRKVELGLGIRVTAAAFARRFCLYGTPVEIVRQLAQVRAAGADAVFLQHVGSYDLPEALLSDVATQVLPLLREAA